MPYAIALVCVIILLGAFTPVTDQTIQVSRQANLDQSITSNNEFADQSAANFRQFKINTVMGRIQKDASAIATNWSGMQLVQYRIFQNPTYVSALSNFSPGAWPVPATVMQGFIDQAQGTIPAFMVREEPVVRGDLSIQRWSIRIDRLRFVEWSLVEQSWLDDKFGPLGAGFSRWVARVDVETTETFWRDQVGLNGIPFDGVAGQPCARCTNPAAPTRGVSYSATAYRRSIEIPVCIGLPGAAAAKPCNDPAFTYMTPLGVTGNACSPPDCRNHVVGGESGCPPGGFDYAPQLVQVP